mmetsp:Transcript_172495/g.419565  ORF Transcript_172495/g.419565 Transcript_172495/m.419565 type:complete len:421 (-) Transcript_172495:170-1432(-)
MANNPLKWPEIEQLGREFYACVQHALRQLSDGQDVLDEQGQQGLAQLEVWLNAPCVATVKLDGTNVGVDNAGLVVGRNVAVKPGENYQKVDVWTLLKDYPAKAECLRDELACAGREDIAQAMLYGELIVNGKYDYAKAGISKGWLCFGAVLRPSAEDDEAVVRLALKLRAEGYNTSTHDGRVTLAPNPQLVAALARLDVQCVSGGYRPSRITETQWAAHDGDGGLPRFQSLRRLLESEWAQRLLLPDDGVPLAEGLVVCSEADGMLFKWKHAGEELGKVPDQLSDVVKQLRALAGSEHAKLLPEGMLDVFELLLRVATAKPRTEAATSKSKPDQGGKADTEALAVWHSALTKFDALEEVFQRGAEAKASRESDVIQQVARDLVKDYGASEKDAKQRAMKIVRSEVGRVFGTWKRAQCSGV